MRVYGIVSEVVERPVLVVESGLVLKSLMEAIIYRLPHPVLVLTRKIYTPNAADAIDSYTVISGDTLEDWKRNLEDSDSMIWMPGPPVIDGRRTN